jgi:hypothetical protein
MILTGSSPVAPTPLFNPVSELRRPAPDPDQSADVTRPAKVLKSAGAWATVATRLSTLKTAETGEAARLRALVRWKTILLLDVESSGLGRLLLADLVSFKSDGALMSTISDVFSGKATRTLLKRSSDVLKLISWCACPKG